MIAEFLEMLSRIQSFKKAQRWQEAHKSIEDECRRVVGLDPRQALELSETELLALLLQGEPTQVVRDKLFMLTRLLKEAADVARNDGRSEEAHQFQLKGLHLLLYTLSQGETTELPDFAPRVEAFIAELEPSTLPLPTNAALMQHYELSGQFGRAEDAFSRMLESEPARPGLVEFGIAFYERLRSHPDAALAEGNLPREEVEAALRELRAKAAQPAV